MFLPLHDLHQDGIYNGTQVQKIPPKTCVSVWTVGTKFCELKITKNFQNMNQLNISTIPNNILSSTAYKRQCQFFLPSSIKWNVRKIQWKLNSFRYIQRWLNCSGCAVQNECTHRVVWSALTGTPTRHHCKPASCTGDRRGQRLSCPWCLTWLDLTWPDLTWPDLTRHWNLVMTTMPVCHYQR